MPLGPWNDRVRFSREGNAYVPGEIAVQADSDEEIGRAIAIINDAFGTDIDRPDPIIEGWFRLRAPIDVEAAVGTLTAEGFRAQAIHVFFSHDVAGSPFSGSPFYGSPFYGSPFYGSPFYGSPFYGSPFYGSPFYGSPFYGSPFYGSPATLPHIRPNGIRPSSARPATPTGRKAPATPQVSKKPKEHLRPHVAILDTGWIPQAHTRLAGMEEPTVVAMTNLPNISFPVDRVDVPDATGDGYLDPITGHATFVAGVVERHAPGTRITILPVLSEYGDGNEGDIAIALDHLAKQDRPQRPHVVNLSFGAYLFDSPVGPGLGGLGLLHDAIARVQAAGTIVVASAGNDGTFAPTYPAALDGVVGVAAVDSSGNAAPFTNYGDWVAACALGVDVVSLFFDDFPISDNRFFGRDPKQFEGWAMWSGTSFASPRVAADVAGHMASVQQVPQDAASGQKLVTEVLGDPRGRNRLPFLGTLVGFG